MNIVFRVDSSIKIGSGHLVRCINLAKELIKKNISISFLSRAHLGNLNELVKKEGFNLITLKKKDIYDESDEDYSSWLGVSQKDDAIESIDAMGNLECDLLIIDHYGIDHEWEKTLKNKAKKILVIDDLANRKHECDFLLDHNYRIDSKKRYLNLIQEKTELLVGPEFALLNEAFYQNRKIKKYSEKEYINLFIFLSSNIRQDLIYRFIKILEKKDFNKIKTHIVLGKNASIISNIREIKRENPNINFYEYLPNLAKLMVNSDIAIGAGGVTTLERMCVGLPSIVISIAENQEEICIDLQKLKLIDYLGKAHDVKDEDIRSALLKIISDRKYLREHSLKIQSFVDGLGAKRLAEYLLPAKKESYKIREACMKDMLTFFRWTNEPEVRKNSLNSDNIKLESHIDWYKEKLKSKYSFLYILESNDLPVGQIRFEVEDKYAIINYSIDYMVRGRGLANVLLSLGIKEFKKINKIPLLAIVKSRNISSIKSFIRLGFVEKDENDDSIKRFVLNIEDQENL